MRSKGQNRLPCKYKNPMLYLGYMLGLLLWLTLFGCSTIKEMDEHLVIPPSVDLVPTDYRDLDGVIIYLRAPALSERSRLLSNVRTFPEIAAKEITRQIHSITRERELDSLIWAMYETPMTDWNITVLEIMEAGHYLETSPHVKECAAVAQRLIANNISQKLLASSCLGTASTAYVASLFDRAGTLFSLPNKHIMTYLQTLIENDSFYPARQSITPTLQEVPTKYRGGPFGPVYYARCMLQLGRAAIPQLLCNLEHNNDRVRLTSQYCLERMLVVDLDEMGYSWNLPIDRRANARKRLENKLRTTLIESDILDGQ